MNQKGIDYEKLVFKICQEKTRGQPMANGTENEDIGSKVMNRMEETK